MLGKLFLILLTIGIVVGAVYAIYALGVMAYNTYSLPARKQKEIEQQMKDNRK